MTRPRALGDASDIPAIEPEKVASAKVYASLADFVADSRPERLMGYEGLAESDGLTLAPFGGGEGEGLLVVPQSTAPDEVPPLFALASSRPALNLCFLDYLTWLPDAEKNPLIALINRAINATPSARLGAYVMDPEGRPRVVVSFR